MTSATDIDIAGLAARLSEDANRLEVVLTDTQCLALATYLEQMLRWNRTYNLTAIRDIDSMRVQHVLDCLAVVPALAAHVSPGPARILDVGSGGGLPGVVLAIARPEWEVCCIDAVEKKTAFVRQMAGVLGASNLSARHARIERVEPMGCDVVISRAFASLQDFASLAAHHVRDGGTLAAMKGRSPDDELAALAGVGGWQLAANHVLRVPGLDAQRCLLVFERGATTGL